ncbi:MAG TPA: helix-turn-helix domain-containing protein [Candidatus Thermoplasmatota archaeon]|nr:helix-turn-helix domain-containing protein [Candidatus Thermoplasmatota archaeon]
MTARLQDAIDRVKDNLELSGQDAAFYVHLCVAGPAKVSDLAEALKVHRNEVYRAAERLVQRGLVQTTVERPARFVAIGPDQVFDAEIQQRLRAIERLRQSRKEVTTLVDQLHALAPAPAKGVYKIIQGRQAIYHQRDQMVQAARESLDWVSTFAPSVAHAEISGTLDLMLRRVQEGVRLRALVPTTPHNRPALAPFLREPSAQVRHFDLDVPVRYLIADGRELLMFVVNDPSESLYAEDEVAVYSTASGFVHAQLQFLEQSWGASRPLAPLP